MRLTLVALGLAATVLAQEDSIAVGDATVEIYSGPFKVPKGLERPGRPDLPKHGPDYPHGDDEDDDEDDEDDEDEEDCEDGPVWHPAHPGIDIDGCKKTKKNHWHWCKQKKGWPHPPPPPHHTWGTSTITEIKTKTVIECDDNVKECPGHPKTKYTTTTIEVTTTICPVPVTEAPGPAQPTEEGKPGAPPVATSDAEAAAPAPAPTAAKPPAPPKAAAPSADASAGPVVVSGASKPVVGILGAVAALVAALI